MITMHSAVKVLFSPAARVGRTGNKAKLYNHTETAVLTGNS